MRQHSQTIPASEINPQSFYLQLLIPVHQRGSHFPRDIRTSAHASHRLLTLRPKICSLFALTTTVLFSCIGGGYFLGLDHRIGHPMPFRSTPRLAAAD